MGITYMRQGDYHLPDLTMPDQPQVELGAYAGIRRRFLQEYHRKNYFNLLTSCTLIRHLYDTEQAALTMEDDLVRELAEQQGVTEELKAQDQMSWVRKMNAIRQAAREIVLHDIIYAV